METISQVLFWVANSLLIPDILLLLLLLLNPEHCHSFGQATGLLFQRGGGSGRFFHQRSVLLSYPVHLSNR